MVFIPPAQILNDGITRTSLTEIRSTIRLVAYHAAAVLIAFVIRPRCFMGTDLSSDRLKRTDTHFQEKYIDTEKLPGILAIVATNGRKQL